MSSTAIMDHEPVGAKPMLQDHTNAKAAPASAREEVKIEEHEPREPTNGAGQQPAKTAEATAGGTSAGGDSPKHTRGEKQIKPNKVYIGGLPEHTRQEDLQNCFGKIGVISAIELKLGYGFVEFESRTAAEESVAKYHGGYFMGNKIRVELSHGGGRTAKYAGEPGACFKCGQQGHWARECPTSVSSRPQDSSERYESHYGSPPREYGREDFDPPGGRYFPPSTRDSRYAEIPALPLPGRDYRDYRPPRPLTPPARDFRDYPPVRGPREYDDYRARHVDSPVSFDRFHYPPSAAEVVGYREPPPSYSRPVYGAGRDSYDRRGPPPPERYPYSSSASNVRPRSPTPAGRPLRDEYDRPPPVRDYLPPDYRGRMSPRYSDDRVRYRRRSQSPIPSRGNGTYADNGVAYPSPYAGQRPPARATRDDYRPPDRNGRA